MVPSSGFSFIITGAYKFWSARNDRFISIDEYMLAMSLGQKLIYFTSDANKNSGAVKAMLKCGCDVFAIGPLFIEQFAAFEYRGIPTRFLVDSTRDLVEVILKWSVEVFCETNGLLRAFVYYKAASTHGSQENEEGIEDAAAPKVDTLSVNTENPTIISIFSDINLENFTQQSIDTVWRLFAEAKNAEN